MDKIKIFGLIALLSFLAILFTPLESDIWIWPLILGLIFGIFWLVKK